MALGGGTWFTQNKKLPGSYINFVSAAKATANLADRGYCAFPMVLNWGETGKVFTVEGEDFQKNSLKLFGYSYDDDNLKPLREIFRNAKTLYLYRVGVGAKASSTLATAKYAGIRGNDIKITATATTDNGFIIVTKVGDTVVDEQTITTSSSNDLVSNDYVDFTSDVTITAQTYSFTGGTNGTASGTEYQAALAALESYSFNVLGCDSSTDTVKDLFIAYTKRMRDEVGAKFQCVVYDKAADYEGVINVVNKALDGATGSGESLTYPNETAMTYWVAGAEAGCAINKSLTNTKYDGEYTPDTNYTQTALGNALDGGQFIFHKVNDDVRVLEDINSFISFTKDKTVDFASNQTIRVCDQIAIDIANLFNTYYLGKVPNDNSGRISLWTDIVKHHKTLQDLRAIEDFDSANVTVAQGETKKSVVVTDLITVTNAMAQLYMTVVVS